jgi:hypothetical protein
VIYAALSYIYDSVALRTGHDIKRISVLKSEKIVYM